VGLATGHNQLREIFELRKKRKVLIRKRKEKSIYRFFGYEFSLGYETDYEFLYEPYKFKYELFEFKYELFEFDYQDYKLHLSDPNEYIRMLKKFNIMSC